MDANRTHTLKHPLTLAPGVGETTLTSVTLRRATAGDMLLIDEFQSRPIRMTINMVARLGGLTAATVERLDAEDYGPLAELAMSSMPAGPTTGDSASPLSPNAGTGSQSS